MKINIHVYGSQIIAGPCLTCYHPTQAYLWGLAIFVFAFWRSISYPPPPPGTQKETIPQDPELLIGLTYVVLGTTEQY